MKREEKNQRTRERILESAGREFAKHGFSGASMNEIVKRGGISKGIIYHYFPSKENLYLACVRQCFQRLTGYLEEKQQSGSGNLLTRYFDARMQYFLTHPIDAQLFSGAVLDPPAELSGQICEETRSFRAFNRSVLTEMLNEDDLRPELSKDEILTVFEIFQNVLNSGWRDASSDPEAVEKHEAACRSALDIFLYGILRRN